MSDDTPTENLPTFGVTGEAETETKTALETRGFAFTMDEPEMVGGDDDAPSPVEYLAGSWAGCLNVVCHLVADEMDLEVGSLTVEVEGELDPKKFMGRKDDVRAGYHELRANVSADVSADEETVEAWIEEVEERCPVTDNLADATPTDVSVTTE
jgi:uncharacterized OsmC-like protein